MRKTYCLKQPEVSKCVEKSLNGFLSSQTQKFKELDQRINQLQSISDSLVTKISDHSDAQKLTTDNTSKTKFTVDKNPTKCFDKYEENFISSDQSKNLS